jgi:hypothetical protein
MDENAIISVKEVWAGIQPVGTPRLRIELLHSEQRRWMFDLSEEAEAMLFKILSDRESDKWNDNPANPADPEPPDNRAMCCECEAEAVGWEGDSPFCAFHYRNRGKPTPSNVTTLGMQL